MQHTTGRFDAPDGLPLFRQSWRPDGAARAVLVNLHGLGDHSGLYLPLVEFLVPRGIAVHAFDLRGHGRSGGQRAFIERWAEYRSDLATFLRLVREAAAGLPVFLAGNSLGGLVVLDYAITAPATVAGIIAVSPPLGRVGVSPLLMALGRVMSRIRPRFSLEARMDLGGLSRDPAVVAEVLADPLFHRWGTARLSTEVTAAIARVHAGASRLVDPLLLLHGGADRMVPPDGTRRFFAGLTLPDRTFHEYPGAYHALFADLDSPRVLGDVGTWLDAHITQPGPRAAP